MMPGNRGSTQWSLNGSLQEEDLPHSASRFTTWFVRVPAVARELIANLELRNSSVGSGWPLIRP